MTETDVSLLLVQELLCNRLVSPAFPSLMLQNITFMMSSGVRAGWLMLFSVSETSKAGVFEPKTMCQGHAVIYSALIAGNVTSHTLFPSMKY